jgi:hypothetical protein
MISSEKQNPEASIAPAVASRPPTPDSTKPDNDGASSQTAAENLESTETSIPYNKDYRFWLIMMTLCFAVTLSSLESTVVITSLPTIVEKLGLGKNYIWVANAYFLSRSVIFERSFQTTYMLTLLLFLAPLSCHYLPNFATSSAESELWSLSSQLIHSEAEYAAVRTAEQ